ncbi:MAG TPA: LapA family protein [Candidatus Paceibacterota bacterium]
MIFLIIGLILGALTVVFALQNTAAVGVTFLAWQIEGSLALILMLAVLIGIIIFMMFSLPELIRTHFEFVALQKKAEALEEENAKLRVSSPAASASVPPTDTGTSVL